MISKIDVKLRRIPKYHRIFDDLPASLRILINELNELFQHDKSVQNHAFLRRKTRISLLH